MQPTTRDIQTITPPQSAATTRNPSVNHTRNNSTEDAGLPSGSHGAHEEEGGSSEIIKMPYGTDGAFSVQCPGKGESLYFSEPSTSARKSKLSGNEKGAFESKDKDAKVKRSMMSILGLRKRSMSKVAHEVSPTEREMNLSEHSGYCSSLDRSTELKVYHGALKMNLLSPEMPPSREPPYVDIHPLKLETVLSENPEPVHVDTRIPQPHGEVNGSSFASQRDELDFSSQLSGPLLQPEKQNSKNSWWKSLTTRSKRRKNRGSSKPDDGSNVVSEIECESSCYPSDTSASQSFRKEPAQDVIKTLLHQSEYNIVTTKSDNAASILTSSGGRSQSCRQDPSKRVVYNGGGFSQSMRFDSSSSLLNTIHEKQGPDRQTTT